MTMANLAFTKSCMLREFNCLNAAHAHQSVQTRLEEVCLHIGATSITGGYLSENIFPLMLK
jgi:NRPS condensation-like uncharacterized protein